MLKIFCSLLKYIKCKKGQHTSRLVSIGLVVGAGDVTFVGSPCLCRPRRAGVKYRQDVCLQKHESCMPVPYPSEVHCMCVTGQPGNLEISAAETSQREPLSGMISCPSYGSFATT